MKAYLGTALVAAGMACALYAAPSHAYAGETPLHTAPTTVIQQIMKALKDGKTLPVHRVPYVAPTQPLPSGFPAPTPPSSSTSPSSTAAPAASSSVIR